ELKLEETQQNLLRIDDTLAEVTRNLNSLKRQAGKARRHRELSEELSTAKRALYKGRIVIAEVEQHAAEASVAEAQARESELAATLAGDEATLAETRANHDGRTWREVSDQIERERQERSHEVRQHEKALQQLRESLMRTIAKISEARNQVHQIEIAVEKCDFYLTKLIESARKIAESRDRSRDTLS